MRIAIRENLGIVPFADAGAVSEDEFLGSARFKVGAGVGFTIAIVLMAAIREQLELANVPEPLRGAGISLIVTGIIALAFLGFSGMIKQ